MRLVEAVLNGDRLALARLLTQVEQGTPAGLKALDMLFQHTGKAYLIGVTGSPGSGKSSLVNRLVYALRHPIGDASPKRVAVIAVDPSSPFSGGALLGDRVRMRDLAGDAGVFIRSMASRGNLGGLARATVSSAQVLDAAGFEVILIETVGAGQAEVDIARLADTILVVGTPGMGDEIQAIKAGILEIADILVINKADQPGVEEAEQFLRMMVETALTQKDTDDEGKRWSPPIVRTIALRGEGVQNLLDVIQQHAAHLENSGQSQERVRHRLEYDLINRVQERLLARWWGEVAEAAFREMLERIYRREISPCQAAEQLVEVTNQL
ncbi:MAG: methylmalonyl Co-A mutase-associated GTPase MeaB [Anaerolineae bacterium]|nr:methylmalonyl Co-A mutase-associated GTPase MeaB [Anaerolineae bacterium]